MEKSLEIGRNSVRGSFQLFIGVAVSTIIMAVGTLILAKLLVPEEYGLYSIALIPSSSLVIFRDWGVNSALTKYIASYRAKNANAEIRHLVSTGLIFEFSTGLLLLLLSLSLAPYLASAILHRPESASLISIVSLTIFSGSLIAVAQSSFIGFERMDLNSLTAICQAIVKTIIGPLMVMLGLGVLGAVLGYTFSFLAAGILGLLVLYLFVIRRLPESAKGHTSIFRTLKMLLKYGIPLSISSIFYGMLTQFCSFMMVFLIYDTSLIGNYQLALNFTILLTFLTMPISTVLFPAFAKLDPKNESQLLKSLFSSSVKYTSLLVIPAAVCMMILSEPLIRTLYQDKYLYAPFFLTLSVVGSLLVAVGSLSIASFLSGLGETKMLLKQSLLSLLTGLPLASLLIPHLGIAGLILGTLLSGLLSVTWGLHWAWKHYGVKADFKSSAKIFASSAIAAVITYSTLNFVDLAEWAKLAAGITIFLTVYIITTPALGALTLVDIDNLRIMVSDLGIISKLVNIPLTITEKIAKNASDSRDRS